MNTQAHCIDYGFVRFSDGSVEHESSAEQNPLAGSETPVRVTGDAFTPDELRRPVEREVR